MDNICSKVLFRIAVAIMVLILLTGGSGAEEWKRTFGESGSNSIVYVKQTSDGGCDIIGETFIQGGPRIGECKGGFCWDMWLSTRKIWFSKINAKGDVKLSKILITGYSNGGDTRYFAQTSDGGYIIAANTLTYGSNYSFNTPLIIKIDSDGKEQ